STFVLFCSQRKKVSDLVLSSSLERSDSSIDRLSTSGFAADEVVSSEEQEEELTWSPLRRSDLPSIFHVWSTRGGRSMEKTVHYCCVSKGNRALYVYIRGEGDQEIEQLAQLCLGNAPAYHRWYFETIGKRAFGFLMEDGYVYFAIVDEGLRNSSLLRFLEYVRDEFKKVARKGSRGSFSGLNSVLQEQLLPVISQLINSLEHIASRGHEWNGLSPSTSNVDGQIELANCTKAPLLGKPGKQDKKKSKDHVIAMRGDVDEHKISTDHRGGIKSSAESTTSDQGAAASQQKDSGLVRIRPSSQNIRKKWWRQVKIVLAIDVVVCLVLFGIWLLICRGFGCIR
ncbi:Phytolongin Phyl1.1, partial [Linum perenne]